MESTGARNNAPKYMNISKPYHQQQRRRPHLARSFGHPSFLHSRPFSVSQTGVVRLGSDTRSTQVKGYLVTFTPRKHTPLVFGSQRHITCLNGSLFGICYKSFLIRGPLKCYITPFSGLTLPPPTALRNA